MTRTTKYNETYSIQPIEKFNIYYFIILLSIFKYTKIQKKNYPILLG